MNLTFLPGNKSIENDLRLENDGASRIDLGTRIRQWAESPYAWTFFFLTTFFVFSSFFLEGKVLLSSSDHTFNHYPNLLFGHRMLRQGDFGLWNPLIFGGVDFTSSFHHHMLHPLNWPLLLLPEQFVLYGVSVQCYLELSLIGLFAFQVVRRVENDSLIALFVAVVAQLGGFAWFTTTTLIATHLLFAASAAIYVIVSHTTRRPVLNYLYLALCFFDILMMGHIAYIAAFGLPVVIVFFWWTWPQSIVRPWQGLMPAVTLAFVTAFCLSAVRLWPVLHGLMYEQAVVDTLRLYAGEKDQGYFVLAGFVPEIFGLHHSDSFAYDGGLVLGRRHMQFHNLLYYGIAPILLVWLSILRGLGTRSFGLAATFLVIALSPLYLVQPLSDLVNIAVFPVYHEIMFRTGGMFLLCAALVPILRQVRDAGIEPDDWRLRWFLALVGIILASCLAMLVRASQNRTHLAGEHFLAAFILAKVLVLAGLPACFVAVSRLKLNTVTTARLTRGAAILFSLAMIVLGIIALRQGYFWNSWLTFRGFAYTLATGLWALFSIWFARQVFVEQAQPRWQRQLVVGAGVAAILIYLIPIREYNGPREDNVLLFSGALSMVKFVLLASVALEIVVLCGTARGRRKQLLPLLGLLTIGELVGQTKLYSHVGTHPFINAAALYPRRQRWDRVHADWLASANGPDILKNASLQSAGAAIPDWTTGGSQAAVQPTNSGVKITASAQDGATLFQDVTLPDTVDSLTMGAWVRSTSDVPVKLMLHTRDHRDRSSGADSRPYSGHGEWEWLTATVICEQTKRGRPHIALTGVGEAEIAGLSLVKGVASRATPRPAGAVHVTSGLTQAEEGLFSFDIKNYRVNKPTQVLRWQDSEVLSNINMVYEVPTYAGVDSDVKKNFSELINAFDGNPSDWNPRMGAFGTLTNPRLLDILGVKYDWDGHDIVTRPDALARFSVFEHFEVCTNHQEMLARLKQPDFDPVQTIVLDAQPPQATGNAARFQTLDFESHGTSHLKTQVNLERPSVLLFNDSYSKYWECTCNGQPVPVMTANGNFMAVALPAGLCQVEWAFRPIPVLRLFWLSVATSVVLAGVAVWAALSKKQKIAVENLQPALKMAA